MSTPFRMERLYVLRDFFVGHNANTFVSDIGSAIGEIDRLRALVAELRTALQELSDVQGVAPYAKDPQYDQAMAQAKAALEKE